ncbi:MAG: hypothetical protein HY516_04600 [Candidatus Aenigmarchaeota archaeon]|nr:hypothetical protein [Candidatus Aenigmarchaeota archaeon]
MIPDLTENARKRVFWPKVALIGSLRFYQEMRNLYEEFGKEGIDALVPWPHYRDPEDATKYDPMWSGSEEHIAIARKQELETQLLGSRASDLAYVVNPDGLIEDRDAVVIGFTLQAGKDAYCMKRIPVRGLANKIHVKTPQEIIEIARGLKETKYRPLLEDFRRRTGEHDL